MRHALKLQMERAVVKIEANRFIATLTNYRVNRGHFAPDMLLARIALAHELRSKDRRIKYYIGLYIADRLRPFDQS